MSSLIIGAADASVDPRSIDRVDFLRSLPVEVAVFDKNRVEQIRTTITQFRGNLVIDLRAWAIGGDGEHHATPKGLVMNINHLPALAASINEALRVAIETGLVRDGEGGQ